MPDTTRFPLKQMLLFVLVLAVAGGARGWYLHACADNGKAPAPLEVQGSSTRPEYPPGTRLREHDKPTELDALVHNLVEHQWYGSLAPLADKEERTAHRAPGYPWLFALVSRWSSEPDMLVRWAQGVLGTLAAGFYFLFALRAFRSKAVGLLTGIFCALHPFWIINTAELNDGVLASFLLAAGLFLGTMGSQEGGPVTSLLFGLSLAGLAMVRAALLPFAFVAMLWFLLRCRKLPKGWFGGLLAFLGFVNGLMPWAVRNYQVFGQPIPVADSALWHLWVGNNPNATGGPLDDKDIEQALAPERLDKLRAEPNQAARYTMLGREVLDEVTSDPSSTLARRLWAGLYFVFGESWFSKQSLSSDLATPLPLGERARGEGRPSGVELPSWFVDTYAGFLQGSLVLMLLLGTVGWRWSYPWRKQARLATLAALWLPLPYWLSHADALSGPRLPLDGVLLCYAAFTLACLIPGSGRLLLKGPGAQERQPGTVPAA